MDRITRIWVTVASGYALGVVLKASAGLMSLVISLTWLLVWAVHCRGLRWPMPVLLIAMLWGALRAPTPPVHLQSPTNREAPETGRVSAVKYAGNRAEVLIASHSVPGLITYTMPRYTPDIFVGRNLEMDGRLSTLPSANNPGEFDPRTWGRRRGVLWKLRGRVTPVVPASTEPGLSCRLKLWSRRQLDEGERGYGRKVMAGLLLGERRAVPIDAVNAFQNSGTAHLLAVSGLHVGAFAWSVWFFLSLFSQRVGLRFPHRISAVGALLATAVFVVVAQAPLSAQRAAAMIGIFLLGKMIGRPPPPTRLLAIAALAMLWADPETIFSPGFQFSFGAVSALILTGNHSKGPVAWLRVAVVASVATWPVQAWHFGTICPFAPLANLILTPITALFIVPMGLLALAFSPFTQVPLEWAALMTESLVALAEALSELGGGLWTVGSWFTPALMLPPLMWLIGRFFLLRGVLAAIYLGLLFWLKPPQDYVDFISVGQGDAILLVSNGHAALVDAGPSPTAKTLVGHLRRLGIGHLDWVAVTHHHPDHFAGLQGLLESIAVDQVRHAPTDAPTKAWSHLLATQKALHETLRAARAGDEYLGHFHVRTFTPVKSRRVEENDKSLAFRIDGMTRSVLLTGDLEKYGESRLAGMGVGPIDVLNLGHHGSRTSSTSTFLDAVQPRLGVASCGRENRFGFPHPVIRERFQARGIPLLNTGDNGWIRLEMTGGNTTYTLRSRVGHGMVLGGNFASTLGGSGKKTDDGAPGD